MASNKPPEYIHGFTAEEQVRLIYQNQVLSPMIYAHTDLSKCKRVLEIGCGVGAQMIEILKLYPGIHVTGLDISEVQIAKAKENLAASGFDPSQYELWLGEPEAIPEPAKKFDAVILVWVLEHVPDPGRLLESCKKYLKTHARIHLTEVYNRSFDLYPSRPSIRNFWEKMNDFQSQCGGQGNIGLQLGNLLKDAGYRNIRTISCPLFFDKAKTQQRGRFMEYWTSLMKSCTENMIKQGMITREEWAQVESDMLDLSKNPDTIFYYSWIQASAVKLSPQNIL